MTYLGCFYSQHCYLFFYNSDYCIGRINYKISKKDINNIRKFMQNRLGYNPVERILEGIKNMETEPRDDYYEYLIVYKKALKAAEKYINLL